MNFELHDPETRFGPIFEIAKKFQFRSNKKNADESENYRNNFVSGRSQEFFLFPFHSLGLQNLVLKLPVFLDHCLQKSWLKNSLKGGPGSSGR